jgi:hypothetical protein
MPPIDPVALRARVAALTEQVYDPPRLAAGVRALLDDYADRAHRPSPKLTDSTPPNTFKTPAPVVRAVVGGLRAFARASPHAAMDALRAIWAGGSREERRIAAELLGAAAPHAPEEAFALLEACLPEIEGGDTAEALARHALAPLLMADPAAHLRDIERWATQPQKWTRCFGLFALSALAKHKTWEDVPGALDAINSVMGDPEPEVRKAAAAALGDLVPKSRAEVIRFLREQAARPNHNIHLVVRAAMLKLDPDDQAEIVKVMRE